MRPERQYQPAFQLKNDKPHGQVNQPARARIHSLGAEKNIAQRKLAARARR